MARLAKIESGVVVNVILGEREDFPDYLNVDNTLVSKGWLYDGSVYSPPPEKYGFLEMEVLLDLIPDEVIDSLDALSKDQLATKKDRGRAKKIIIELQKDKKIKVENGRFNKMMNWLKDNCGLTDEDIQSIKDASK